MPREPARARETQIVRTKKAPAASNTGANLTKRSTRPFTFCFTINYRNLTVPEHPEEGYPTGNVPPQLRSELLNLFTELLKSHKDRPEGDIQVAMIWQRRDSAHDFDVTEIRPLCEEICTEFQKDPGVGAYLEAPKHGVNIAMTPSLELYAFRLRALLAEVVGSDPRRLEVFQEDNEQSKHLIAEISSRYVAFFRHLSPDQQCLVGDLLASQYDSVTGEPAAFVTFSNFLSEIVEVGDVCRFLKRSRSAVTTYVQEGLLPAIRVGEKQYLFFRKHVERFTPPKKGPRIKTDDE